MRPPARVPASVLWGAVAALLLTLLGGWAVTTRAGADPAGPAAPGPATGRIGAPVADGRPGECGRHGQRQIREQR